MDPQDFLSLYEKTFDRQGIEIDEDTLTAVTKVLKSLPKGEGFLLVAKNEACVSVSATLVLTDSRMAYSLFTVNDPGFRKTGANTALVIEALQISKRLGLRGFDFIGANSPNRADYKISFNAKLTSYFESKIKHERK